MKADVFFTFYRIISALLAYLNALASKRAPACLSLVGMTIITRTDEHTETEFRIYPAIGRVHAESYGELQAVWGDPVMINGQGPDFSELTDEVIIGWYFPRSPGNIVIRATFTQGVREYRLRILYSHLVPEVRTRAIRDGFA